MKFGFLTVLDSTITEMGLSILDDHKRAKAILLDYAHGEFRNEINFLLLLLEKGYFIKMKQSNEIEITKQIIINELVHENYIQQSIAEEMINILVEKIENKNTTKIKKITNNPNEIKIEYVEKAKGENKWICRHCNKENYNNNNICNFCGKYTYHNKRTDNTESIIRTNKVKKWICSHCKTENNGSNNVCISCGKYTYH
jgi:hypothetical protein